MVAPSQRLVTARELAETLGVSARTVRAWGRNGTLPRIEVAPRVVRFDPDAIARRLAEREASHTRRPLEHAHRPANLLD